MKHSTPLKWDSALKTNRHMTITCGGWYIFRVVLFSLWSAK
jgi:hypothetical protein